MARTSTSDQLKKYRSMRDFKKTREPAGSDKATSKKELRYLIQKHAATRLHYDFRLEMDGVLKSWAVTRGPSLDPADKRLAVHVEDHPIEYGDFEGTIPKGEYGGGTVMLWDTGSWEPVGDFHKDYAKGKVHIRLKGKRLKGEWVLLKMRGRAESEKRENWLLIKVDDKYAKAGEGDYALEKYTKSVTTQRAMETIAKGSDVWHSGKSQTKKPAPSGRKTVSKPVAVSGVKKAMPKKVELQLATLVDKPPAGSEWVHEVKFDGYRLLARIEKGKVRLLTRAGNDWTKKFQSIADALAALPIENALIDGEVVSLDAEGKMAFHALQQALSENDQSRMQYFAFDLLYLNDYDLTKRTLLERKELLEHLIPADSARLHYSQHFTESGNAVFQNACSIALEGIISKRADARYVGTRSEAWLKVKCTHEQEFVIGGYTEQKEHPGNLGALLMGYYASGNFKFAGKVGTGFTLDEGREILKQLRKLKSAKPSFSETVPGQQRRGAIWVKPSLVAQVTFGEWTPSGHMRHPVFNGIRKDKSAQSVTREVEKSAEQVIKKSATAVAVKKTVHVPARKSTSKNKQVGGVTLTHPERVLFEEEKITKADLAAYYHAVAPLILPHVAGRPVSLMRCPEGSSKQCFFQRHASPGMPESIHEVKLDEEKEKYLSIEDENGLIALVQLSVLEIHVWGAMADDVDHPDRIVLDFDPDEKVSFPEVKKAVLDMKKLLDQLKLKSFIKTTGGKGLHIVVPFKKGPGWPEVKAFSHAICQLLQQQYPDRFTTNSRKDVRKGKIFLDYLRNDRTSSAVAPYSVRARKGAPVAMPIDWKDLPKLKSSNQFTLAGSLSYLKKRKADPWKDMKKIKQSLPQIG